MSPIVISHAFSAVDSDQSFQNGLKGATNSSIASALAAPHAHNVSAYTIVSLQLPIAGSSPSSASPAQNAIPRNVVLIVLA